MTDRDARTDIFARLQHSASGLSNNDILREQWALGSAPAPALPGSDLHEAFLTNVLKNRGTVDCAVGRVGTVKAIAAHLYANYRKHRLVASNDQRLAALPWRDGGLLPRFGSVEANEQVAVSYARLGVAELGAVVTFTGKANAAANNLLPEQHVVLVDAADVVTASEQAWEKIAALAEAEGRPRGINFIAGPSSTADIEGQLVYGAHGPKAWHVILVGDIPDSILQQARANAGVQT
ncbi:MAG: lactate utilization protein C [Halioglobus sp.]